MLSDNKRLLKLPVKKNYQRWFTDKEKLEAVKLYLITGNQAATAAALNISKNTMCSWVNSQWFKDLSEQIRREGKIQLTNKLKTIAAKAQDVTLDRLENGDWIYDQKTGEMRRKPVSARDAGKIANDFLNKSLEIEDRQEKIKEEDMTSNRLAELANAFTAMANKTTRVEVIEHADRQVLEIPTGERGLP